MQSRKIAMVLAGLIAFTGVALWLVVSSSLLAGPRGDLTARILSSKLGRDVEITGGVVVSLGSALHVRARDVSVPSQTMDDIELARVGQVEFNVTLRDLIAGRIAPFGIQVADASAILVIDSDAQNSWGMSADKSASDTKPATSDGAELAGLLAGQEIRLTNSNVTYKDARTGLDIDLALTSLALSQKDQSAPLVFQGTGAVNGQDMTLNGSFPREQPFKATLDFDQMNIALSGGPDQGGYAAGFSTAITVEIGELGQLLDVLKLQRTLSGTGQVSAVLKVADGVVSVWDVDVRAALYSGQSLEVTGELGDVTNPYDVTLDTIIRLYSEAGMPPAIKSRRELKLTGIEMGLAAQPDGDPTRRMVIETNGFVLDTGGVGLPPISVSEISRTPDGLLRVGEAVLRIGPPDAPFLVLEGAIEDALRLEGIDLGGTLSFPAALIFGTEAFQTSKVLGGVTGGFRLRGSGTELGLTDLIAVSEGSDLWHLNVTGSIGNTLSFSDADLEITADIPSGVDLLTALGLDPVDTGIIKLSTNVSSDGTKWLYDANISVAQSQLNVDLDLDFDDQTPSIRGQISSDLIRVQQIRDIIAASLELAKIDDQEAADTPDTGDGKRTEPLVLDKPTPDNAQSDSADGKRTEPLILAKPGEDDPATAANPRTRGPFRDVTLRPFGRAVLLSGLEVDVAIDLRKIEGEKGSSSLKSDLRMKDEQALLGPLEFEYGGGYVDFSAALDVKKAPDMLQLSGSTGGWDFGTLLQELKIKKRASGVMGGSFDVSGKHASFKDFLATVTGAATVSMRNGSIDSQLLDLAGLGIIPWLFTKDRGPTAPIVCVQAPLTITKGRISTKQSVLETDQVQIVLFGNVDLNRKTLDISGQPRRIGKPLSRSPWPFTAVGPMAKPKIKVKSGPRRLRRADGATTMPERRKLCVPDILQLR
jgi:AsmA family protein